MKKLHIYLASFFIALSGSLSAQVADEMMLLFDQNVQGTARYSGMGGAFNSVGGDFGSLSTNPAGIGIYRSSELSLTPALSINQFVTDYLGNEEKDSRTRFGLSNFGYVATWLRPEKQEGLVSFNIGIGYNKVADFSRRSLLKGYHSAWSKSEDYAAVANGDFGGSAFTPNGVDDERYDVYETFRWSALAAAKNDVILYDNTKKNYYSMFYPGKETVNQIRKTSTKGSTGEYVFTVGGNISNKFYFGATMGMQDVNQKNVVYYSETNSTAVPESDLDNFWQNEYFYKTGMGLNLKIGAIIRPIDPLKIGIAIHTPTWYDLTEKYSVEMGSNIHAQDYFETYSGENSYDYQMTTPYRFESGISYTFGNIGLISVDYELVGYRSMRLIDDYDSRNVESFKNEVKNSYRNTSNVRIGAEVNVGGGCMVRGGFNYMQSPYKDAEETDKDFTRYLGSLGFGYRTGVFFVDVAYVLNIGSYHYGPTFFDDSRMRDSYVKEKPQIASEKQNLGRAMVTFGIKF